MGAEDVARLRNDDFGASKRLGLLGIWQHAWFASGWNGLSILILVLLLDKMSRVEEGETIMAFSQQVFQL